MVKSVVTGFRDVGNLQQESISLERIVVQHHSGDVAEDFEHEAADHADHETPCPVVNAQAQMRDQQSGEKDCEEEVGAVSWSVEEGRLCQTAGVECAHVVGDAGVTADEGVWVLVRVDVGHLCDLP